MKSATALVLLASSATAFSPSVPVRTCSVSLFAKHANNKAAKKANHNRPRKSRPSDINRKPVVYDEIIKPPEYTIIDGSYEEAAPTETYVAAKYGTSLGMIMNGDEVTGWIAKTSGSPMGTFEAVDWTKMPQGREVANEPEDDALAWLEKQSHEDAMAWIQSKLDNVKPVDVTKEELAEKLAEFSARNPTEAVESLAEQLMSAGSDAEEGSALSLEKLGLPPDAELIEIVDDKELAWQ
jgi:hypothetical protein